MRVYEVVVTLKDEDDNPTEILIDAKFIAGSEMSAGMKGFEQAKAKRSDLSLDDMDIKVRGF